MYIYIFIWLFLIGGVVNITQLYNIEKNENNIVVKRWISLMAVVLFFPVFWTAPAEKFLFLSALNGFLTAKHWKACCRFPTSFENADGKILFDWYLSVHPAPSWRRR